MQVRQYAYFMIRSETVPLADMTGELGTEPDVVSRRGSRSVGPPPRPVCNIWRLESGCPDTAGLDDHLGGLLRKLEPIADKLQAFLASFAATGTIQVFREMTPGPEDDEVLARFEGPFGAVRLPGQHPLLSFHLDPKLVRLAAHTGVELDFDEYGDEDD